MSQEPPKNCRYRIGAYIEIPGLKMDPLAALSLVGLMEEPIRRALEAEKLLSPDPLSPLAKENVSKAAKQIGATLKGLPPGNASVELVAVVARNSLRGILANSGIQVFPYFNWFFILVDVSDVALALVSLQKELERLSLLQYAEIAHIDPLEKCCRTFYPPGCVKPFERHLSLVHQLDAYGRNLLQGGSDA
jgi:hypothetical protein